MKKQEQILVNKLWLIKLVQLGEMVNEREVQVHKINYLLGYIESAKELLKERL